MSNNSAEILETLRSKAGKFDVCQSNMFKNAFCEKAMLTGQAI